MSFLVPALSHPTETFDQRSVTLRKRDLNRLAKITGMEDILDLMAGTGRRVKPKVEMIRNVVPRSVVAKGRSHNGRILRITLELRYQAIPVKIDIPEGE